MKSKRDRQHHAGDSFWTSYSDLFLGMSVIFLLLYVAASLRNGTDGLTQAIENQKLKNQVEDLRTQLKAYDSIRKDYLDKEASPEEGQAYEELMDKLSLLQEEARDEREKMKQSAADLDKKEKALNQYQQMVRNIINANVMAKTKIKTRETVIGEQDAELAAKKEELAALEDDLQENINRLKSALKANKLTKKAYEQKVAKLKRDSAEEAEALKEEISRAQSEAMAKAAELKSTKGALDATSSQLESTKGALAAKSNQLENTKGALAAKESQLKDTEGLLAKARAEADARKAIARDIKAAFAKAGVKADVNENTGEVEISFGDVYFDNDSANLKPQMKAILEKAIPAYSKSLLGNEKVSSKISSVEIIGFASPTYKGRYVDPKNLDEGARKAVNYNLDLSYNRARSLFKYVFDERNMKFPFQKDMLPLIKVTGRSFLAEANPRAPAAKGGDFCNAHDCKKAQKVIIRFNFDEKK